MDLWSITVGIVHLSIFGVVISGVTPGFLGRWWREAWIWLSLALLIALFVSMSVSGSPLWELSVSCGNPVDCVSGYVLFMSRTNPQWFEELSDGVPLVVHSGAFFRCSTDSSGRSGWIVRYPGDADNPGAQP